MFGKCKVCVAKDAHISDLKDQLNIIQSLLNPPPRYNATAMEASAILSSSHEQIEISEEKIKEDQKAHNELMSILNASY